MSPDPRDLDRDLTWTVAARLYEGMRVRHLSQRQLADLAGISERTLTRILSGNDVRLSTLQLLAAAIDTELATLLKKSTSAQYVSDYPVIPHP